MQFQPTVLALDLKWFVHLQKLDGQAVTHDERSFIKQITEMATSNSGSLPPQPDSPAALLDQQDGTVKRSVKQTTMMFEEELPLNKAASAPAPLPSLAELLRPDLVMAQKLQDNVLPAGGRNPWRR